VVPIPAVTPADQAVALAAAKNHRQAGFLFFGSPSKMTAIFPWLPA